MKKTLLILSSLAALALAGCTKVETFSSRENSGNEIGFATYTGRALTKSGTALGQSFNVEGFLSGTPSTRYFFSTSYRYANNRYTGDTTRYWPVTGNLDFYAVSPLQYMNTSGTAVDLKPVDSTFTVTKTDGKTDIVAARLVNVLNGTDPVTLEFGHKLTKVSFKAVGFDATKNYKISSITVVANSSAKYSYGADSWTDSTDTHEYTFLDECKSIPVSTTTPVALGDTLFLIPSQAATIKAQIRYSIYDGAIKIDTTVAPVEVNLPVSGVWGINKSVVYKLTLNISSTRNPINFSATVEDWDADTEIFTPPHYIDNGIDYGIGTKVGNTYWAPVNCGYEEGSYDYGKLYQWGRKYPCEYNQPWTDGNGTHGAEVQLQRDSVYTAPIQASEEKADLFYVPSDLDDEYLLNWLAGNDSTRWNSGTEDAPVKTAYDPCPEGWRVPTRSEMNALWGGRTITSLSDLVTIDGIKGLFFNGTAHPDDGVFLPLAGVRVPAFITRTGITSYWTSGAGLTFDHTLGGYTMEFPVETGIHLYHSYTCFMGCSIRCVAEN